MAVVQPFYDLCLDECQVTEHILGKVISNLFLGQSQQQSTLVVSRPSNSWNLSYGSPCFKIIHKDSLVTKTCILPHFTIFLVHTRVHVDYMKYTKSTSKYPTSQSKANDISSPMYG